MTKDITIPVYAKWYGCSPQYIGKQIRENKLLPHVLTIKKWHRFYLLEVEETLNAKTFIRVEQIEKQPLKRGRKPKAEII